MNTHFITTTELRTRSSELVKLLAAGKSINLVHRSKMIGEIQPQKSDRTKTFSTKEFSKKVQKLHLPKLTLKEIDRRYRKAMMKKHGKYLS